MSKPHELGDRMTVHSAHAGHAQRPARIRNRVPVTLTGSHGQPVKSEWITFEGLGDHLEHVAIQFPSADPTGHDVPLVRLHSECLTGDTFASRLCDCGAQLAESIARIAAAGGYVLYLRQEGRGIGLYAKLDTYALQQAHGLDTFQANEFLGHPADGRSYLAAAQMLQALGATQVDVITNNPDKVQQLRDRGIEVRAVLHTAPYATPENNAYLAAKIADGHWNPNHATDRTEENPWVC